MKIGLFGFDFTSSNKGCEALTYTFLSMMESLFPDEKLEAVNFSYNQSLGVIPEKYPNIDFKLFQLNFSNPKFFIKAIKEMKSCVAFFDATYGDGFSDIYGKKWNIKTDLVKQLVLLSGTPLVLAPQTFGPFEDKKLEKWAMHLIKKAKISYTRDDLSAKYVKKTCKYDVKVASDMAFKLPFDKSMYSFNNNKIKIGINISSLLWDSQWAKENHFGLTVDYHEFHDSLIEYLLNDQRFEVHIIPHVIDLNKPEARENDYRVCLELGERYNDKIFVAPPFETPVEAKSYISNMDVFIGSRMHATIGAISSGVATIPFSYSRKFEGLFGNLDYPYVISARAISTEQALDDVKTWINEYDKLKNAGRKAVEGSIKKLDNFEKDILTLI